VAFLEGGYHLVALALSVRAVVAELLDLSPITEPATADCAPPVLRAITERLATLR
jgi:hypothetical protein